MKNKIFKIAASVIMVGAIMPAIAFAQSAATQCNTSKYNLACLAKDVTVYFQMAIYLVISLAVVTFIWNVYKYFFKADADKKEASLYVLYSAIGFFVILSIWGLVNILTGSFALTNTMPAWPFGTNSTMQGTGGTFGTPGTNATNGNSTFGTPGTNVTNGSGSTFGTPGTNVPIGNSNSTFGTPGTNTSGSSGGSVQGNVPRNANPQP